MLRVGFEERAQVRGAILGVATAHARDTDPVLRIGAERVVRILRREIEEQRRRIRIALEVDERPREIERRRRRERVVGGGRQQLAEVLRRGLEAFRLQFRPGEAVQRIGRQRRRRVAAHVVERRARLGIALEPEERLRFPQPRLQRPPWGRRHLLRPAKHLERPLVQAHAEPRAAQQQRRSRHARVVRIVADETLQDARGERVKAVGDRALTDEIQPVRLFERDGGGDDGDQDKEHEGGYEPLPALHVTFHGSTPITGGMLVAA